MHCPIPTSSSVADPPHSTAATEAWEVPGVMVYKTSEHYMTHQKALLFGAIDTAADFLRAAHPRKAQSLGRLVHGFDQVVWEKERLRIVSEAILLDGRFTSPLSCRRYPWAPPLL